MDRKKKSKFRYLVQQVEEQSFLCDFTLKVGFWTKRYHRCVLVTCPYFEKAVRGNFIEKQKGLADIGVGTPYTVNTAIMYLYGVVPDINKYNVEPLLEQAEYFMIAGLKSTCINWLRSLDITHSNYVPVLKLSSVYNFEVPNCITYIESHLPEVIQTEESLFFSKELVKKLFTDERLSYVTMDERLLFLRQWVNRNTEETRETVGELIETIDMNDVTDFVWQHISQDFVLNEMVDLGNVGRWYYGSEYKNDTLIMTGEKGSLSCLNLQNDTWYHLKTPLPEASYDSLYRIIAGIRNTKPEVYFTKGGENMMPIFMTLNLESNERNDYKFTLKDDDISTERITNICLEENTLLVLTRKRVQMIETYTKTQENDNPPNTPVPSTSDVRPESLGRRVRIPVICENGGLYPSHFYNKDQAVTVHDMTHTAVHVGTITNKHVEIVPLFYLRNIDISQACVNSTLSTIGLLPKEKDAVILFDLINFKMEKFSLEQDVHYTLSTTNKGFVIYNNTRCYCLTAMYWSLPSQYYLKELFELQTDDRRLEYIFSNGYWIRFSNRICCLDLEMSYIRHEELLMCKCSKNLKWKNITIPDVDLKYMLSPKKGLFVVQLSKRKLRCHIHCPHCKYS